MHATDQPRPSDRTDRPNLAQEGVALQLVATTPGDMLPGTTLPAPAVPKTRSIECVNDRSAIRGTVALIDDRWTTTSLVLTARHPRFSNQSATFDLSHLLCDFEASRCLCVGDVVRDAVDDTSRLAVIRAIVGTNIVSQQTVKRQGEGNQQFAAAVTVAKPEFAEQCRHGNSLSREFAPNLLEFLHGDNRQIYSILRGDVPIFRIVAVDNGGMDLRGYVEIVATQTRMPLLDREGHSPPVSLLSKFLEELLSPPLIHRFESESQTRGRLETELSRRVGLSACHRAEFDHAPVASLPEERMEDVGGTYPYVSPLGEFSFPIYTESSAPCFEKVLRFASSAPNGVRVAYEGMPAAGADGTIRLRLCGPEHEYDSNAVIITFPQSYASWLFRRATSLCADSSAAQFSETLASIIGHSAASISYLVHSEPEFFPRRVNKVIESLAGREGTHIGPMRGVLIKECPLANITTPETVSALLDRKAPFYGLVPNRKLGELCAYQAFLDERLEGNILFCDGMGGRLNLLFPSSSCASRREEDIIDMLRIFRERPADLYDFASSLPDVERRSERLPLRSDKPAHSYLVSIAERFLAHSHISSAASNGEVRGRSVIMIPPKSYSILLGGRLGLSLNPWEPFSGAIQCGAPQCVFVSSQQGIESIYFSSGRRSWSGRLYGVQVCSGVVGDVLPQGCVDSIFNQLVSSSPFTTHRHVRDFCTKALLALPHGATLRTNELSMGVFDGYREQRDWGYWLRSFLPYRM